MKYQINNFKIQPTEEHALEKIIKARLKLDDFTYKIIHKSIDARMKDKINLIYKLMIETDMELKGKDIEFYKEVSYKLNYPKWNDKRPVVVGFGPAGMFAALYLARCGAKPIIVERGGRIEDRKRDVEEFLNNKVLNPNSNVQFGEGGAGAFSDGKLTTNVKNPLTGFILYELHKHGALENIMYEAKPHIGTDYLEIVVKNIREEIESLGGTFYFYHRFINAKRDGHTLKCYIEGENNLAIDTNHILLGLGHSAKDTIRTLYNEMNLDMEQKAFSMGVRIEHPQELINEAQYGKFAEVLPPAYYNLAVHMPNGRGVYTFCMCPGGYVLASQSEEGTIVVNGMSNNKRDNINSNSAILVDVKPSDYDKGNVLDGLDYQEKYERLAYNISGDYKAPANLCKEFLHNRVAKKERSVKTSYPHGLFMTDLSKCLPDFVVDGIKWGINGFNNRLRNFRYDDAILIGIESRSSSPVRILRDKESYMSTSFEGIYPIGEGAGYAGGITSAALDGLKCAIEIAGGNKYGK